jgi:hypothetical protein
MRVELRQLHDMPLSALVVGLKFLPLKHRSRAEIQQWFSPGFTIASMRFVIQLA